MGACTSFYNAQTPPLTRRLWSIIIFIRVFLAGPSHSPEASL